MRKLLMVLFIVMLLWGGAALAEEATPTPAPTQVPDLIAQSDATRRPIETATPRPADAPLPEDPFLGHAVELGRRLGMLAESAPFYEYCNRTGASREVWDAVSMGDHTTPARVFILTGENLVMGLTDGDPSSAPWFDMSRPELRQGLVYTLPEMMYASLDQETVSCIRAFARFKVFAAQAPDSCGVIVMLYQDATPVIMHWYENNGAVSLAAYFMPLPTLAACRTAADVSAWFASLNMPVVAFEEVTW